jgi:outer membrane immunogenic protein
MCAFGLSGVPAFAADVVEEIPAPEAAPEVFTWTGLYIGGNIGWGGGGDDKVGLLAPGFIGQFGDVPVDGIFGGGQIGYNWQVDNWVFGLEADFQFSGMSNSATETRLGRTVSTESNLDWYGTLRPRLGYAFDRTLIYGTGGLAYGQVDYSIASTLPASSLSEKDTYVGWTLGGGAEYAFTDHWSGRLEYQYINLGREDLFNGTIGTASTPDFHSIRVGINYKF